MNCRNTPTNAIVESAKSIWAAGKDAVVPSRFVPEQIRVVDHELTVQGRKFDLSKSENVFVLGAGKASEAMAIELSRLFEASPLQTRVVGQVHTIGDPTAPTKQVRGIDLIPVRLPAENFPTVQAQQATRNLLSRLHSLQPTDTVIGLISGGGSAMLVEPRLEISLEEKLETTRLLSNSGADIIELNIVRSALSEIKGGRLLNHIPCRQTIGLILSDIMSDEPQYVASGPTYPLHPNPEQALAVLKRYDKNGIVSDNVYHLLNKLIAKRKPLETVGNDNSRSDNFVVANNRLAVEAAERKATSLGYSLVPHDLACSGDAERLGVELAHYLERAANGEFGANVCLITGSETTVKLCENPGAGGRNQQLVLAALEHLSSKNSAIFEKADFCFLSAGTDGEDGPTNAAGAWFDQDIMKDCIQRDDLKHYLTRNDAMTFFDSMDSLFVTGPTQTNVCDIQLLALQLRES